jgi:hypothetical protein
MFASILSDMALLCFYAKDTPCRSFWKIRVCDYPSIRDLADVELRQIIYIGDDDATDAFCSINARVLPFAAHYSNSGRAMNYGLPVPQPIAFHQYVRTFGMQNSPYFGWSYDGICSDTSTPIQVRVLFGDHSEMGITPSLKKLLKQQGAVKVGPYNIDLATLVFHYLVSQSYFSGITHAVDWITIYPGHEIGSTNPLLAAFSTYLTKSFRNRFIPDLLVRHRDAPESKSVPGNERKIIDQFRTIVVNDAYRSKIAHGGGKTVLVLDDFTTSGSSLEVARRMLLQAGAKQVIGIAVAKYRQTHTFTRITRRWNPYEPCTLSADDIQVISKYGTANHHADHYFHSTIWPQYSQREV